jgi:serine/threonine protein kinase
MRQECSVSTKEHPHISKLLATYEHKNKYHIIFPYADSNLWDCWACHQFPTTNPARGVKTQWVLQQIRGIAEGLRAIHYFTDEHLSPLTSEAVYGRHGDLKAENILCFTDDSNADNCNASCSGTWQLSDFGLSRFHRQETRSNVPPATVGFSSTYAPPELLLRENITWAYDIWSFGCIVAETATWMLRGAAGLEGFADARLSMNNSGYRSDEFYSLLPVKDGPATEKATVKPSVQQWLTNLKSDPSCSDAVADLLALVENQLLVASPVKRSNVKTVVSSLDKIIARGYVDSEYLCQRGNQIRAADAMLPKSQSLQVPSAISLVRPSSRVSTAKRIALGIDTFRLHPDYKLSNESHGKLSAEILQVDSNAIDFHRLAVPVPDSGMRLSATAETASVISHHASIKRGLKPADDESSDSNRKKLKKSLAPTESILPLSSAMLSLPDSASVTIKSPASDHGPECNLARKRATSLPLEYLEIPRKKRKFS